MSVQKRQQHRTTIRLHVGFFSLETFFYLTVIFRFQGRWKMRPTQQGTKAHLGNWFLSKGLLPNFGKDQIPPVSWVIFTFSLIQTLKDSTIHIQLRDCFLIHPSWFIKGIKAKVKKQTFRNWHETFISGFWLPNYSLIMFQIRYSKAQLMRDDFQTLIKHSSKKHRTKVRFCI